MLHFLSNCFCRIANEEDFRKIMEKVPEYRIKPEKVKQILVFKPDFFYF